MTLFCIPVANRRIISSSTPDYLILVLISLIFYHFRVSFYFLLLGTPYLRAHFDSEAVRSTTPCHVHGYIVRVLRED